MEGSDESDYAIEGSGNDRHALLCSAFDRGDEVFVGGEDVKRDVMRVAIEQPESY